jgi:hypothetical protein
MHDIFIVAWLDQTLEDGAVGGAAAEVSGKNVHDSCDTGDLCVD